MDWASNAAASLLLPLVERRLVPDILLRVGMRLLLRSTLNECRALRKDNDAKFADELKTMPIAVQTEKANEQHYEVGYDFYVVMLGPWLKYSCGLWPSPEMSLQESEEAMLNVMCERAELNDQVKTLLDLGCGWGSAALFIAAKYPHIRVTCVSNSNSQRDFITAKAKSMGLSNVTPVTMDANVMSFPQESFDRVVSNEMFEHMKNYKELLAKVAQWLKPRGKLFVHIFTHRIYSYHFAEGWMAENFFTGGTMPSANLLSQFQDDLHLEEQWKVNGKHYSKTLECWLARLDANEETLLPVLKKIYGGNEKKRFQDWRLFNLACSELFRYNEGEEWFVSHYRFVKKGL